MIVEQSIVGKELMTRDMIFNYRQVVIYRQDLKLDSICDMLNKSKIPSSCGFPLANLHSGERI